MTKVIDTTRKFYEWSNRFNDTHTHGWVQLNEEGNQVGHNVLHPRMRAYFDKESRRYVEGYLETLESFGPVKAQELYGRHFILSTTSVSKPDGRYVTYQYLSPEVADAEIAANEKGMKALRELNNETSD